MRGNWQRRVERTEARRVANKLQKEQRRAKRHLSSNNDDKAQRATWYRLLSEWLDDTDFFPSDDDPGDDSEKGGSGQYNLIVDIWTDARPKDRQEYLPTNLKSSHGVNSDDDFEEEDGRGGKGRSKPKTKDRGGFKKSKGKKKAHPNTKQKTEEEDVVRIRRESRSNSMSVKDDDKLCAKEFFFGKEKCPAGKQLQQRQKGGKRGNHDANTAGCSLQHYHQFPKVKSKIRQSPPLTLVQVVNGKYQPHPNNNNDGKHPTALPLKVREACLQYAYDAMLGTDDNGEDAAGSSIEANMGIENIYHTRIYVTDDASKDQEDNEGDENDGRPDQRSAVVDALEQLLDREKLSQTSLVYLTIQGVLVYDLNRGGLVFSEAEEDFLVSGEDIDMDAFLQYNAVDTVQSTGPSHIHEEMNHHVLYDILSFLPDEAAAVLPQVCKSWRDEVGTKSPQLWKMLLNRHNWPFSVRNDDQVTTGVKTDTDAYKDAFISHYVAVRDIRAIASAAGLLCGESNDFNTVDKSGLEYAMQRYKSTKGAPVFNDEENHPAQVKIWSESVYAKKVGARALVAYTHDYTLRLFEVVPRNNSQGSQNSSTARSTKCRQIACVKAVPPSVSQRRAGTYALGGIGLDEDNVACLFSCAPENLEQIPIDPPAHFLSIISRDDLACAGNEGHIDDDSLREFDIRAMILDFLLCGADHVDHLQTALHEYLSFGQHGDTSHITVEVSPSLVSCGQGFFLFLAFIDIPVGSNDDTGDSDDDGSSINSLSRVGHRVFLFSIKKGRIVKSLRFPADPFGSGFYLHASNPVQNHFITGNVSSVRKLCTNVVIKSFDSADEWLIFSVHIAKNGTVDMQMKTLIDGHQIEPVQTVDPMPVVVMSNCAIFAAKCGCLVFLHDKENEESLLKVVHRINVGGSSTEIYDIFGIREEYVAVVLGTSQGRGDDEEAVAGEWFGLDEEQSPRREVAVFHVSSRQELFRCQLPYIYPLMFHMDCFGDTIAANVAKLGFVIAGGNAREVAMAALNDEVDTNQTPTKTTKAKKKRLASLASGRKKDGFARGMSMRG